MLWKSIAEEFIQPADREEVEARHHQEPENPRPTPADELSVLQDSFTQGLVVKDQSDLQGTKKNQPQSDKRPSRLLDKLDDRIRDIRLLSDPDVTDKQGQMDQ